MLIHDRSNGSSIDEEGAERAPDDGDVDLSALLRSFREDWDRLRRSTRRLAVVEFRRLHLRAVELFFVALFYACAFMTVLTVTTVAAVFFLAGLRAVFARWMAGGLPELIVGACGLGMSFGVAFALRAWLRHRIVRLTARRLAVLGATSDAAPPPIPPVPASPGGAS